MREIDFVGEVMPPKKGSDDQTPFVPSRLQRKFLQWFVEELDLSEMEGFDLNTLAYKFGISPLKLRRWFRDPQFKVWFYEQVDEIFKLYARVLAKQMFQDALKGTATDREKMTLIKLFLQPARVYQHEYKSVNITVNKQAKEEKEIYDYEIIKPEESKND